jgi:hypothetical protein
MIVSASYKTDIPTFYGEWFLNRLKAGYCMTLNPYAKRVSRISLERNDVDGFVFWTKNVGPFLEHLSEVHERCFPFVLQHTINGYPRQLEQSVVDAEKSVQNVRRVAETFGPRVCVWRYDTIVMSSLTPREFHVRKFAEIARGLEGATDEVVISFAHIYRKTLRNMTAAARESNFTWSDPSPEWKRELSSELAQIAASHRMRLTVCSQPDYLAVGCSEARCIDANRLADVSGRLFLSNEKGNREGCRCAESRDIGDYDTCPHGCVYCYAVQNRALALERYRGHNPQSEFLFAPGPGTTDGGSTRSIELTLLDNIDDR